MTKTLPAVHRLEVQVTEGRDDLVGKVQQEWADFEASTVLPFGYQGLSCGSCKESSSSPWAELHLRDEVATIRVTPKCLNEEPAARRLTLLHESLHLASFVGSLREMYEAVREHRRTYLGAPPIAHWLGCFMYEVDAEFALVKHYPELAGERAAHYIKMHEGMRRQNRDIGLYAGVLGGDPGMPYAVVADQLCAELAGLLAEDVNVEVRLCQGLPREVADEGVRQMLSPKTNDYSDLPRWGAARYEAVVRRVIDQVPQL